MKIDAINFQEAPSGPVEIIVREGKAAEPVNPQPINISGDITAPFAWYEKHRVFSGLSEPSDFTPKDAHLEADVRGRILKLTIHPELPTRTVVTGTLQVSDFFKDWRFGESWGDSSKLADFIRKRKRFFTSKDVAAKLISALQTFEADVQTTIEKTKDRQGGNYKNAVGMVVKSNIPNPTFELNLPLFDGYQPVTILVEIVVEPRDGGVSIYLESIEAEELVEVTGERIVKDEIGKFRDELPVIFK